VHCTAGNLWRNLSFQKPLKYFLKLFKAAIIERLVVFSALAAVFVEAQTLTVARSGEKHLAE
jgi:hypothetical protein